MRARGTGTVKRQPNDRWTALRPGQGKGLSLGTFDTKEEAETALGHWCMEHLAEVPARAPREPSQAHTEGRAVAAYLEALRLRALGKSEAVGIGRVPGLPATSTDPEVVDRAAAHWQEQAAQEASILKELELRARARRLAEGAQQLRAKPDLETGFVKYAASYGKRKGVQWETWREMGVPAEVLRAAGISP